MKEEQQKLYAQRILIIGGSSGIGLATAQKALEQGYHVTIASRSEDKLASAKNELSSNEVQICQVDTTDESSIQHLFETVGTIDHLMISGSEVQFGNIHDSSIDEAKKSFDSKFFGPFRVIQKGLNYLKPNGSIILFSGTAGTKPEKGTEILAAINGAVDSFSRALAVSLSPIRVNSIAPGIIDTPPVMTGMQDEKIKNLFEQFTRNLPIQRMGHANEVAEAALYLIKNTYVTGTTLYVDGGHVVS